MFHIPSSHSASRDKATMSRDKVTLPRDKVIMSRDKVNLPRDKIKMSRDNYDGRFVLFSSSWLARLVLSHILRKLGDTFCYIHYDQCDTIYIYPVLLELIRLSDWTNDDKITPQAFESTVVASELFSQHLFTPQAFYSVLYFCILLRYSTNSS